MVGGRGAHSDGRRLTAIVFTDIVGYSAVVHRDEALGEKLLDRQRAVVRRFLRPFGGREVDTIGDGFLLEFGSALSAVQAIVAIQQELARQNAGEPESARVVLRAGVHLGDVEHRGKGVYGDGVNIAARIMPLSPEGGLALSAPVLGLVRQRLPLPVRSVGSPELKNIATPVEIFVLDAASVHALEAPMPTAGTSSAARPAAKRLQVAGGLLALAMLVGGGVWVYQHRPPSQLLDKSVAVLPFTNMSSEKDSQYFSDGMQEEILTAIAKIRDLKVISRTSTEKYRGQRHGLKTIARELGVATIMEGAVQRVGGKVRINVQLIDATTDAHVWAESYDRDVSDIFAVQSEIALKVAEALKATLLPAEVRALDVVPTRDPKAYDLYLQGAALARPLRFAFHWDSEASHRAEQLLQQALERDPAFALAAAELAAVRLDRWWLGPGEQTEGLLDKARSAAELALKLGPDLGQAHVAMGYYLYAGQRDYARALEEFEKARAALPNDAWAVGFSGFVLRRMGRWDESVDLIRRSANLSPQDATAWLGLGDLLMALRRYDEAVQEYDRSTAVSDTPVFRLHRAWALVILTGDLAPMREEARRFGGGADHLRAAPDIFNLQMWSRDYDAAMKVLETLPDEWLDWQQQSMPKALLAGVAYRARGQQELARQSYARAADLLRARYAQQLQSDTPQSATPHFLLARAYAGLGRAEEARAELRRAEKSLPLALDAWDGMLRVAPLAATYAWIGDANRAFEMLRQLLQSPIGGFLTPAVLRLNPDWDPLRKDPRFEALVHDAEARMRDARRDTPRTSATALREMLARGPQDHDRTEAETRHPAWPGISPAGRPGTRT